MTTSVKPFDAPEPVAKLAKSPTTPGFAGFTIFTMQANRVRFMREDRGLTQEELAERVGSDKGTISRIESGRRRLTQDWMNRIARVLECAPWELLPLPEQPEVLAPDEKAVLELYRGLSERERAQFRAVANALAQPGAVEGDGKKRGNGGTGTG